MALLGKNLYLPPSNPIATPITLSVKVSRFENRYQRGLYTTFLVSISDSRTRFYEVLVSVLYILVSWFQIEWQWTVGYCELVFLLCNYF